MNSPHSPVVVQNRARLPLAPWARTLLRPARVLHAVLAAALLSPLAAPAQATAPGSITGRVLNASNDTYLGRAVVEVEGTNLSTLTDDSGAYSLRPVPAGPVRLRATYFGLPPQSVEVNVPAGGTVRQDVSLGETDASGKVVRLDPFTVESQRFQTAQQIAINEERNSVNLKEVVAADFFGNIPGGNVGEFIKFLPGIELDYGGTYVSPTDAYGISVRGFGAADTAIYIDGVPVASAPEAGLSTAVALDMLALNNASRVELIKMPTPDMPMNSIGGQINLITRTAFEHARPELRYRAYVTVNSEHLNPFAKVAGPGLDKVRAGSPGFELSYVRPINEKLGLTVSASQFSQYSAQRRFRTEWGTSSVNVDRRPFGGPNGAVENALGRVSLANPYLTRVSIYDSPRTSTSRSGSLKVDWRPFDGLTVAGSYAVTLSEGQDNQRRMQIRTQSPMSWDATSTVSWPYRAASASANGAEFRPGNTRMELNNLGARDKEGISHTASLRASYRKGPWDIRALASVSTAKTEFVGIENGHFQDVDLSLTEGNVVGQIRFEDIVNGVPGRVTVLDRAGAPIDFSKLASWRGLSFKASSGNAESLDDKFNYKVDVRRELGFLPLDNLSLSLQAGFHREENLQKKWGQGTSYRQTYTGPALAIEDYMDTAYSGRSPGWGFAPQEWPSVYRLFEVYQARPQDFVFTDEDNYSNWFSIVGQNKRIKEISNNWYAMLDGRALNSRLGFNAGLRDEDKKRKGFGPVTDSTWNRLKNKDGTLYRNPALLGGDGTVFLDRTNSPLYTPTHAAYGALRADLAAKGIAYPVAPLVTNNLEKAQAQRKLLQPIDAESKGKPSYSAQFLYKITDKLDGRIGYTRTFGRIAYEDGTNGLLTGGGSGITVNEAIDPTAIPRGTITVANPNLLPEVADNYELALAYHTDQGGKFGVSYYTKRVENFTETIIADSGTPLFSSILNSIGLDPDSYQDWRVSTSENGTGTGRQDGYELRASQPLNRLPWIGQRGWNVTPWATYSHHQRRENNTTRLSARPAASSLVTGGIDLRNRRFSVSLKSTWSDVKYKGSAGTFAWDLNNDGINETITLGSYNPSHTKVDLDIEWRLSPRYILYLVGRNIFEGGVRDERFDLAGIYPAYAHWDNQYNFGVQWTFGVKGTF